MLYDIKLAIDYEFETPANAGRHLLRMLPRNIDGVQRVLISNVDSQPEPAERLDSLDFFGNQTVSLRLGEPTETESFHMRARVEKLPRAAPVNSGPTLAMLQDELATIHSLEPESPHHFLPQSRLVKTDKAVADWAAPFKNETMPIVEIVSRICSGLHAIMKFDPQSTDVDTPMAEAFRKRRGVCQDFTHIMIAALRSLHIPAGYVSGFLRTIPPKGSERLEGADAMHAWVRAWCGSQTGWVEFDPTNNMRAELDHVIVAYGRDYFDVAPVKGTLRLAGGQASHQSVDMVPLPFPG
ncbi:MAG: transglutaminase family protein [Nitratireductor sp.]